MRPPGVDATESRERPLCLPKGMIVSRFGTDTWGLSGSVGWVPVEIRVGLLRDDPGGRNDTPRATGIHTPILHRSTSPSEHRPRAMGVPIHVPSTCRTAGLAGPDGSPGGGRFPRAGRCLMVQSR